MEEDFYTRKSDEVDIYTSVDDVNMKYFVMY